MSAADRREFDEWASIALDSFLRGRAMAFDFAVNHMLSILRGGRS